MPDDCLSTVHAVYMVVAALAFAVVPLAVVICVPFGSASRLVGNSDLRMYGRPFVLRVVAAIAVAVAAATLRDGGWGDGRVYAGHVPDIIPVLVDARGSARTSALSEWDDGRSYERAHSAAVAGFHRSAEAAAVYLSPAPVHAVNGAVGGYISQQLVHVPHADIPEGLFVVPVLPYHPRAVAFQAVVFSVGAIVSLASSCARPTTSERVNAMMSVGSIAVMVVLTAALTIAAAHCEAAAAWTALSPQAHVGTASPAAPATDWSQFFPEASASAPAPLPADSRSGGGSSQAQRAAVAGLCALAVAVAVGVAALALVARRSLARALAVVVGLIVAVGVGVAVVIVAAAIALPAVKGAVGALVLVGAVAAGGALVVGASTSAAFLTRFGVICGLLCFVTVAAAGVLRVGAVAHDLPDRSNPVADLASLLNPPTPIPANAQGAAGTRRAGDPLSTTRSGIAHTFTATRTSPTPASTGTAAKAPDPTPTPAHLPQTSVPSADPSTAIIVPDPLRYAPVEFLLTLIGLVGTVAVLAVVGSCSPSRNAAGSSALAIICDRTLWLPFLVPPTHRRASALSDIATLAHVPPHALWLLAAASHALAALVPPGPDYVVNSETEVEAMATVIAQAAAASAAAAAPKGVGPAAPPQPRDDPRTAPRLAVGAVVSDGGDTAPSPLAVRQPPSILLSDRDVDDLAGLPGAVGGGTVPGSGTVTGSGGTAGSGAVPATPSAQVRDGAATGASLDDERPALLTPDHQQAASSFVPPPAPVRRVDRGRGVRDSAADDNDHDPVEGSAGRSVGGRSEDSNEGQSSGALINGQAVGASDVHTMELDASLPRVARVAIEYSGDTAVLTGIASGSGTLTVSSPELPYRVTVIGTFVRGVLDGDVVVTGTYTNTARVGAIGGPPTANAAATELRFVGRLDGGVRKGRGTLVCGGVRYDCTWGARGVPVGAEGRQTYLDGDTLSIGYQDGRESGPGVWSHGPLRVTGRFDVGKLIGRYHVAGADEALYGRVAHDDAVDVVSAAEQERRWHAMADGGSAAARQVDGGLLIESMKERAIASYEGDVRFGLPHGRGKVMLRNGGEIRGRFACGLPHGRAFLRMPRSLATPFSDALTTSGGRAADSPGPSGRARLGVKRLEFPPLLIWGGGDAPTVAAYDGEWIAGVPNIRGEVRLVDGSVYDGEMECGTPHGEGSWRLKDGTAWRGTMMHGMPHGYGSLTRPSGTSYVGWWSNGLPSGHGRLRDDKGRIYDGPFEGGLPHGLDGYIKWPSGWVYRGVLVSGRLGRGALRVPGLVHVEGAWDGARLALAAERGPTATSDVTVPAAASGGSAKPIDGPTAGPSEMTTPPPLGQSESLVGWVSESPRDAVRGPVVGGAHIGDSASLNMPPAGAAQSPLQLEAAFDDHARARAVPPPLSTADSAWVDALSRPQTYGSAIGSPTAAKAPGDVAAGEGSEEDELRAHARDVAPRSAGVLALVVHPDQGPLTYNVQYLDGSTYVGEWEAGGPEGHGSLTFASPAALDFAAWTRSTLGISKLPVPNVTNLLPYVAMPESQAPQRFHVPHTALKGSGSVGGTSPRALPHEGSSRVHFDDSADGAGAVQSAQRAIQEAPADTESLYDGATYVGDFRRGLMEGPGVMTFADGGEYDGRWVGGLRHGMGVMTYGDGSVYRGTWRDGLREGHGTIRYKDGRVKTGEWFGDCVDGEGTLRLPEGQEVGGTFFRGKLLPRDVGYYAGSTAGRDAALRRATHSVVDDIGAPRRDWPSRKVADL